MLLMQQNFQQNKIKILFIGGNGRIGNVIVPLLSKKYSVIVPNSKELNWSNQKEVSDYLTINQFDVLINLSYYYRPSINNLNIYYVNKAIIDNIKFHCKYFKQIIQIGSIIEEIGQTKYKFISNKPLTIWRKQDLYEINKYYALSTLKQTNNYINLRIPPCFGIQSHIDLYIHSLIYNYLRKDSSQIDIPRNDIPMPYLYVYDLASIIDYIIQNKFVKHEFRIIETKNISKSDIAIYIKKQINNTSIYANTHITEALEIKLQAANSNVHFSLPSKLNIYQYIEQCIQNPYSVSR